MRAQRISLAGVLVAFAMPLVPAAAKSAAPAFLPPGMELAALPLAAPDPADNPTTPAKIALGRLLFFDPILSATKELACATCHHPTFGWADGRAVPNGVGGAGLGPARVFRSASNRPLLTRNAPSIVNAAFNGLLSGMTLDPAASPMFWDARVAGLEQQAFVPLRSHEEMRGDVCTEAEAVGRAVGAVREIAEYRERFAAAFGRPSHEAVTAATLAQAIAAFERSLIAPNSPFDRFQRGETAALGAEAQRGLKVFQDAGCILCHGGPMFSDFKLHFIGVTDPNAGGGSEVRTPTLRNLARTAPYMHNGSLRSLEDVFIFYEQLGDHVSETLDGGDKSAPIPLDPLLQRIDLAADNFPALEAFLRALNDDRYDRTVPATVPSGLPVAGHAPGP